MGEAPRGGCGRLSLVVWRPRHNDNSGSGDNHDNHDDNNKDGMDVNTGWWWPVGSAAIVGAAMGAWVMQRIARFRHGRALLRATDALQTQNASLTDQLRAAPARAQAELEQLRQAHKRRLQAAQAEPLAACARAEQRLMAAYEELDRLRRQVAGAPNTEPSDLGDGFAPTRPMRDGM